MDKYMSRPGKLEETVVEPGWSERTGLKSYFTLHICCTLTRRALPLQRCDLE